MVVQYLLKYGQATKLYHIFDKNNNSCPIF